MRLTKAQLMVDLEHALVGAGAAMTREALPASLRTLAGKFANAYAGSRASRGYVTGRFMAYLTLEGIFAPRPMLAPPAPAEQPPQDSAPVAE